MGCLPSKLGPLLRRAQAAADPGEDPASKTYSWDKRKKVDPAEYTIENVTDDEVGRLPGTINGQQLIIQNCQGSRIFLFDDINTINIDDCSDCSIYVGPVAGRNCKNCTLIAACGQFRTRDCQKIDVFLYCQTKPIIEASTRMRFGCFQSNYPQLNDQFKKSGLNIFNNNWSEIHDFTPVEDEKNWVAMKPDALSSDNFPLPQKEEFTNLSAYFVCTVH